MTTLTFGTPIKTITPEAPQLEPGADRFDVIENEKGVGTCLAFPLERRGTGDWKLSSGDELLSQQVVRTLGTRAAANGFPGDFKPMPEYGSLLWTLKYRNFDETTRALAKLYVNRSLSTWMPHIQLVNTDVQFQRATSVKPSTIFITISFRRRGSNETIEPLTIAVTRSGTGTK